MEGLQIVEILGKKREVYFGLPAIEYIEQKGVYQTFEKLQSGQFASTDFKAIVHFVYAGLTGGCEYRDCAPDFTYGDVYGAVEAMTVSGDLTGVLPGVAKAFSESNTIKHFTQKAKKIKKK